VVLRAYETPQSILYMSGYFERNKKIGFIASPLNDNLSCYKANTKGSGSGKNSLSFS
jgi:hypothetical protein